MPSLYHAAVRCQSVKNLQVLEDAPIAAGHANPGADGGAAAHRRMPFMRAGLAPDQARELVREERAFLPSSGCDFDALGRTVKRQTDQVTGSARGPRRGTLVRASSGRQPALTDDHDAIRVASRAGHPSWYVYHASEEPRLHRPRRCRSDRSGPRASSSSPISAAGSPCYPANRRRASARRSSTSRRCEAVSARRG